MNWSEAAVFKPEAPDYSIPGQEALDRALFLAAGGLPVFPLSPYGSPPAKDKLNDGKGNSGQHLGSTDLDRVREMFSSYLSTSCYGIRGGDGIAIFDIDNKDGKNGTLALYELADVNEWVEFFASTLTVQTPSGGFHFYVGVPEKVKVPTGSDMNWLNGVDMRGRSGWAVGPGSLKVKENGPVVLYKLFHPSKVESPDELRAAILPAPNSLVEWIATARGTGAGGPREDGGRKGTAWAWSYDKALAIWQPVVIAAGGVIPNGSRNSCLWSLASGMVVDVIDACTGIEDENASEIVASQMKTFFDLLASTEGIQDTPETIAERAVKTYRNYLKETSKPTGMSKRTWAIVRRNRNGN